MMGTAPIKVRAYFEAEPGAKCEACIAMLQGLHSTSSLRSALHKGIVEGWLEELTGRCGECRRNARVWRYHSPDAEAP